MKKLLIAMFAASSLFMVACDLGPSCAEQGLEDDWQLMPVWDVNLGTTRLQYTYMGCK